MMSSHLCSMDIFLWITVLLSPIHCSPTPLVETAFRSFTLKRLPQRLQETVFLILSPFSTLKRRSIFTETYSISSRDYTPPKQVRILQEALLRILQEALLRILQEGVVIWNVKPHKQNRQERFPGTAIQRHEVTKYQGWLLLKFFLIQEKIFKTVYHYGFSSPFPCTATFFNPRGYNHRLDPVHHGSLS